MNRFTLLIIALFSVWNIQAKTPDLSVSMREYWHPEVGPYVELYYRLDVASLRYATDSIGYSSGLQITALFTRGDQVFGYDKLIISSPLMGDTALHVEVQGISKIGLDTGVYTLELNYEDIHSGQQFNVRREGIHIKAPSAPSMSTLFFPRSEVPNADWVRYGIPAYPRTFANMDYFPATDSLLRYYTEFYQPNEVQKASANIRVVDAHSGLTVPEFELTRPLRERSFQPVFGQLDLRKLATGNYYLIVHIINEEGEKLVSDSVRFGRHNPEVIQPQLDLSADRINTQFLDNEDDLETLRFYVDCLYPIALDNERIQAHNLILEGNKDNLKRFVAAFWQKHAPGNPIGAWQDYLDRVEKINEKYDAGMYRGYQTDRGRVELQYGEPTMVERSVFDQGTYPYEIWQYNQLTAPNRHNQTNKVFIFVNRQIAGNNYDLIHSDGYGEPFDPQWKFLVVRGGGTSNPDERSSNYNEDPFGSRLNNNTIINGNSSSRIERR